MASSRDDFIIAIRSAFLKKSTQQKFSLLTLVIISILIIILSNLDFKVVRYLKIGINEFVYRSSFIVSIPENFVKNTFSEIREYSTFYSSYKKDKEELKSLRSKSISNEIMLFENKELKELINDYVSSSDKLLAKIIVDHKSPFLKTIIINKGSKDKIKIGTNIYDQSYLVGRVIEVNYKTSRVLLLSDLNSNVPVTIVPENIQAIVTGSGENFGRIKYIKSIFKENFTEKSIAYTSGTGAIFKSGVPIGKLNVIKNQNENEYNIDFFTDFSQLKYVFAEIEKNEKINGSNQVTNEINTSIDNPINQKLKILEDEINIIEKTNIKLKEKNVILESDINDLNNEILNFKDKILSQRQIINQFNIDKSELEFLRLNLTYGHLCRKTFINNKGFKVGTAEYKNCVLRRGVKN